MKKQAVNLKAIGGGILGGILGNLGGKYLTPKMFGYENDPRAVSMSQNMDMLLYAILGAMAGHGNLGKFIAKNPITAATSLTGAELLPIASHAMTEGTQAVHDISDAARQFKPTPSIKSQLSDVLSTPEAKGVGVGLTGAALGALLTGLFNKPQPGEGHASSVLSDFGSYAIPASLIGGLAGHLLKNQGSGGSPGGEQPIPGESLPFNYG